MEKPYKNCQSYGMPLKRDEKGGGTNTDGSRSIQYSSNCFVNGHFTASDMTVMQMQALVKGKLKEFGFPGFIAGFFTKNIPKLERWKK
ncbi:MAG: zinc ribbon domain-containing protein [Cyclobacteriaceae bacterium]